MSTTTPTTLDWSAPLDAVTPGLSFVTPGRTVTAEDVHVFAALTGDHHPQHVDPGWAASSAFGEQIAHGLLVLSCAAGLVPFDPDHVVALRRVADVVFKRPVRLGDMIRVEGSVEDVKRLPGGDGADTGLVTCRWRVLGADDRLVVSARVEVLWR
jgi:acyl dehydratase